MDSSLQNILKTQIEFGNPSWSPYRTKDIHVLGKVQNDTHSTESQMLTLY